jgi:hypothetical protein
MKIYRKAQVGSHGVAFPSAIENQVLMKKFNVTWKKGFLGIETNLLS